MNKYEAIGKSIGELVDKKNAQYGDSINNTAEFLDTLFPNGIPVEMYRYLGILVRMYDKMKRIANGNQGDENAWNDIAGYAILMSEEIPNDAAGYSWWDKEIPNETAEVKTPYDASKLGNVRVKLDHAKAYIDTWGKQNWQTAYVLQLITRSVEELEEIERERA